RGVGRVAHQVSAGVAIAPEGDRARLAAAAALAVAADHERALFGVLAPLRVAHLDAHTARAALDRDRLDPRPQGPRRARLERLAQDGLGLLLLDREHVAVLAEAGAEVDRAQRRQAGEGEPPPHAHALVHEARAQAQLVELLERGRMDPDAARALERRLALL